MNKWFISVISNQYIEFQGRASLKQYWMYTLWVILTAVAIMFIDFFLFGDLFIYWIFLLITFLPTWGIAVRRLHDSGLNGAHVLWSFIPFIALVMIYLLCRKGDLGPNQYGPPTTFSDSISEVSKTPPSTEALDSSKETTVEPPKTIVESSVDPIKLEMITGSLKGKTYTIDTDKTIGRGSDNDIVFDEGTISSHHCEIILQYGVFIIKDLDSTNGTIVNGKKIKEFQLNPGDEIKISSVNIKVIR